MATNDSDIPMYNISWYFCSNAKGLVLPLVNEYTWSVTARAAIYLIGLLWSFMAMSIIADIFMQSIEMITSKTRTVKVADPNAAGENVAVNVKVWNNTVSNLTLMALGSSAPEIMLSVIEIVGNGLQSGSLGPSTIVGSAAFNLFCITGVCIVAIPAGEIRRIRKIQVFAVTASFSMLAYVWLTLILVVISPDYVDLWEAIITFLLFPLLIILAYITDKNLCCKKSHTGTPSHSGIQISMDAEGGLDTLDHASVNKTFVASIIKKLGRRTSVTETDMARIAARLVEDQSSHSAAWYRINAIRGMTGGQKLGPALTENQKEVLERLITEEMDKGEGGVSQAGSGSDAMDVLEFATSTAAVLESDGNIRILVNRTGGLNHRIIAKLETTDGTAVSGEDYVSVKETLVFEPGDSLKHIDIQIIDDTQWEPDEVFFLRLSLDADQKATLGTKSVCQITILNDDDPGQLDFSGPSFLFKESCGLAVIPVKRTGGVDGRITVEWHTKDMAAISGKDYEGGKGELVFEHGEVSKTIEIPIIDDQEMEKDENFRIELTEVTGGATLGRVTRTVVTIVNDDDYSGLLSRVANLANVNLDSVRLSTQSWADQFRVAMNVGGGDIYSASAVDYILHFLTFGFKVIFALVPPPSILGGWLAFFVAFIMIFALTAIVADLASILGCLIQLDDSVTAITLVALGTSLPDLFASKQAALHERNADSSIGNVTGSNSVNVFLGLGFPWLIASIYWTVKGERFQVKSGSLGFSVVLYTVFALLALGFLMVRRSLTMFGKAELGGPVPLKYLSGIMLVMLWIAYVTLASLQVYGHITVPI